MTFGVVLACQEIRTLGAPVPENDSVTLLTLLENDTFPVAAPGEPAAGLNVTVYG